MAEATLTHQKPAHFGLEDYEFVSREILQTRAILRAVSIASWAQRAEPSDPHEREAARWHPALERACIKVQAIRDRVTTMVGGPVVDWATPLSLLESIEAALWIAGNKKYPGQPYDLVELEAAADVAVACLDILAAECVAEAENAQEAIGA
jgi:hypothetical protein